MPTSAAAVLTLCLLLLSFAAAQARQPFSLLRNNADTANRKLYVEIMYEKPGCGDYMAMFTLVDRVGVSTPLDIEAVLNNAGTYELSADRRALMRPQAGGYRMRFALLPGASVSDGYRVIINTYKLAYRCAGCGAAGSDAIFEPKHIKEGCPPLAGEVLACHRRTGRMANWEAWVQDPRDCQPYRAVMLPDGGGGGRWWFAQNLRWDGLGQPAPDGSYLYTWYEAVTGKEVPFDVQLLLTINSDEVGPQGVCPEGWHVPTMQEWHRLGLGMGSGAGSAVGGWQPRALHGLAGFRWYESTGLSEGNDESGFTWLPTPFTGANGINGSSVKHGALWSAGSTSEAKESLSVSRVAAQATATAWAASPLTVDGHAGHRTWDRLPLRCAYGAGVPPTVEGTVALEDVPCQLAGGYVSSTDSPIVNPTAHPDCGYMAVGAVAGASVALANPMPHPDCGAMTVGVVAGASVTPVNPAPHLSCGAITVGVVAGATVTITNPTPHGV